MELSSVSKAIVLQPIDYKTAMVHYTSAAETHKTSIAMYNLGYMHEYGLGVSKDFHLAKRWYDMALKTNPGISCLLQAPIYLLRYR